MYPPAPREPAKTVSPARAKASEHDASGVGERELAECLEKAPLGLQWLDPDGRIRWANQAQLDLLGYSAGEYVGRHVWEFHVDQQACQALLQRMRLEPVHDVEARLRAKNGGLKHVLIDSDVQSEQGQPRRIRCYLRDVTDRKRAEQAWRESEERYRRVFEHNPLPAWVFDLETHRVLAVNAAAVKHYGYSRQEFLGMPVEAIRLEEDLTGVHGLGSSNSSVKGYARHRRKDGTLIHVEVLSSDLPWVGRPARLIVANDVTERKAAEQKLALYHRIFISSNDGIAVIGAGGTYLEQNPAHSRMTGYTDQELAGQTPAVHLGEEQFHQIAAQLGESGRYRGEAVSRRKSGERLDIDLAAFTMFDEEGQPLCHVGIKRDITERKRRESDLRRRLNELEAMHRLINTLNRLNRLEDIYGEALNALRLALQCDRAAVRLFDESHVLRYTAWHGLSRTYREVQEGRTEQGQAPTKARWVSDVEHEPDLALLGEAWLHEGIRAVGVMPLDSHGRLLGVVEIAFDAPHAFTPEEVRITHSIAGHIAFAIERARSAKEIRLLNQQLQARSQAAESLVKYAPDPLFVMDLSGKILQANDAVSQLMGLPSGEIVAQPFTCFIGEQEAQEFMAALYEVVERGLTRNVSLYVRDANGQDIPTTLNAAALRDGGGEVVGVIATLRDMRAYHRVLADLERSKGDLLDKILDLQRFEEVVVGRELRMIELETELRALRRRLGLSS